MQGGINNAGLFGASQREARSKLDQMAGIKRPSGILASSPELMRSVAGPTMGQPQPIMPMAQPVPAPMPMAQAPMMPPAMPMPTTVAPMAQAPAPRSLNPMAPTTAGQQPVVKLAEGGEPFRPRFQGDVPATAEMDITIEPLKFIQDMDKKTGGAVTEQFGSVEAAAKEGTRKASIIESAAEATKDPSKIADAVLVASGEQPTEAAKMDFAENVFGLKDVNDIDEINRRIANVAIGGSVAKSPEEFTQAVLLGLQAYKQTATARAAGAAGAGGEKSRQEYLYKSVFDATYKAALENDPENPGAALAAARTAAQTAAPNAPSAAMGGQPAAPAAPPADISSHQAANDAAKKAGEKIYTIGGEQFNVQ
jgi:hypothetical protein